MRENRTSGLMRGSNGIGSSRPLLSTLPLFCGNKQSMVVSCWLFVKRGRRSLFGIRFPATRTTIWMCAAADAQAWDIAVAM